MTIDVHTHLWRAHPEKDKREILKVAEQFGLSKLMLSSLDTYVPEPDEIRELNELTWGFMREQPELVMGYCYLNPRNADTLGELRTCVEDRGFCGVKLWTATFCDDPLVDPVIERCIEYDIPVLIHAFHKSVGQLPFESRGEHVARLAQRYPEAKLIMAHLGADCTRELPPIKNCKNVWTDFSGSINHENDLRYAKRMVGADRLLFGSDMPGISFIVSYSQVLESEFTEDEKEKILSGNAKKLFKLGES